MSDKDKERQSFEAWVMKTRKPGTHITRSHNGVYLDNRVAAKWTAFQAGRASLAASAGSEPVVPVDRSDAVNLARNMLEVRECKGITPRGVEMLCNAVLAMDAVLLAHPSPPEGMVGGWQDIATAPKTGRTLLLGYFNSHGNWRTLRGQWFSQDAIDETWEEPDLAGEGWYETPVEIDDVPNVFWTEPTHWMPLPAPPIAAGGGKDAGNG